METIIWYGNAEWKCRSCSQRSQINTNWQRDGSMGISKSKQKHSVVLKCSLNPWKNIFAGAKLSQILESSLSAE